MILESFIISAALFSSVKCDILVAGASAAGLMAAISAAKKGAEVVLLERDLGGRHSANTLFEGMAARAGIEISECYLQRGLEGMRILGPSGAGVDVPAKGYFIDRERFDDYYFHLAEMAGAVLVQGEARDMKLDGTRRTVSTGDDEIQARVVVDASGVESMLARRAGLAPMRHPEDIAWAMEASVEHPGLGEEKFFQYWIGSMAPGWKATFSPAGGDFATLGVFVRGHGRNVQPFFRAFLKRFRAGKAAQYRDIGTMKIHSINRGGDPIAALPGKMVADSFMVTGGAAGQSGLAYGMRAGAICGAAAAEAIASCDVSRKALTEYERSWRDEFLWEYRLGRSSLETLRSMEDREIDRLLGSFSGKILLSGGPLWKKAVYAGAKVTMARPRMLFDLAWNLGRG